MGGHGEKLSRRKEQAIAALLSESSILAAAARAGVSESTLRRWLSNPDFRSAVEEARRTVFTEAIGSLRVATTAAVETLRAALSDASPAIRVRTAIAILELGAQLGEVANLSDRLAELERNSNQNPQSG